MELAEHKVKLNRLSSLPDDILIDIISRLPINTAVSTSVLSHRWHHLWTSVTRLAFDNDTLPKLSYILHHLSSSKLDVVKIKLSQPWPTLYFHEYEDELESCIHDICRRKVQQFILDDLNRRNKFFRIPDCLLDCPSLVNLDVCDRRLKCNFAGIINLPNLKKLSLRNLVRLPNWLENLYKSSPLLENLTLIFVPQLQVPLNEMPSLNLFFPNLKSLELGLFRMMRDMPSTHPIISIDAPKLENLVTSGCFLPYKLRTNPTALVKASIDPRHGHGFRNEYPNDEVELHEFSKFFKGVSSVRNLELVVKSYQMNIFAWMNKNPSLFFYNLVRLKVSFCEFGIERINHMLVSMQRFPNLKHLSVINVNECEEGNWRAPDIVPLCIISKLKTIKIEGIRLNDNSWLEFLRYILGNAKVLRNLDVGVVCFCEKTERKFCRSLLKLPRRSRTCEVVFLGRYIGISSNGFKIGKHIVKWPWLIDIYLRFY